MRGTLGPTFILLTTSLRDNLQLSGNQPQQWITKNSPAWAAKQSSRNMAGAISKSSALAEKQKVEIRSNKSMKKNKLTIPQQRRLARDQAMPEVKRLVTKYGRATISGCLNQLRDYEKKLKQLHAAQFEVQKLERELV
jgi:hypothetical protein